MPMHVCPKVTDFSLVPSVPSNFDSTQIKMYVGY